MKLNLHQVKLNFHQMKLNLHQVKLNLHQMKFNGMKDEMVGEWYEIKYGKLQISKRKD